MCAQVKLYLAFVVKTFYVFNFLFAHDCIFRVHPGWACKM